MISSSVIGGAEACYLQMISGLSGLGYEVAAICEPGAELYEMSSKSCEKVYGVKMRDNADVFALAGLRRAMADFGPDLCHLHMNRATLLGALAARTMGVASLGTIQGEVRPIYAALPDYLTFCSGNVARYVRSRSSYVRRKPSFMLYNKVDCAMIDERALGGGRRFVREEFGFTQDSFVVCQVARLHPNKGQNYLIEAVASLAAAVPSLKCLIVGGGDALYEKTLKALSAKLNVEDRVVFTGTRLDVPKIVSGVDAFVLPSLQEGIPVTIMEAMALSVPVICFDVGGIRELCPDSGDERLLEFIRPKDVAGLAEKISAVAGNPSKYKKNAASASERIRKHFDSTAYISEVDAIYKHIFSGNK